MSADNRNLAPPHEVAGQLGQVVDPGGGFVPGLLPTPVPGALGTASPGLAAAALASPGRPTVGPDEPSVLVVAIERLAAELFAGSFGSSAAPVPVAPATALTPSNLQLPASPGLGAGFSPASPLESAADDPRKLALTIERLASELVAGPSAASASPMTSASPAISPALAPWTPAPSGAPAAGRVAPAGPSAPRADAVGAAPPAAVWAGTPGLAGTSAARSPFADAPVFDALLRGDPATAFGGPVTAETAPPVQRDRATGPATSPPGFGSPASRGGGSPAAFGGPASGAGGSPAAFGSPSPAFTGPATTFGGPAGPGGSPWEPSDASTGVPASSSVSSPWSSVPAPSSSFTIPPSSRPSAPAADVIRIPVVGDAPTGGAAPAPDPARSLERGSRIDGDRSPAVIRNLGGTAFDPYTVRRDFPILDERVHGGKRLVWLDNAATTQKPRAVIDRLSYFYEHENSNIHRAAHTLAARATDAYESARESTRRFVNASSTSEIIFVRGATEGINLVAQSWGRRNVAAGDEIVITHLEHHANIVPWQQLCAATGARLRIAPVDDRGDVIVEAYERLLGPRTRLVAFPQVSNALGTVTPAREMIEIAHRHGAVVLLDGAQAVSHMRVDVQQLDCDFYVLSGHKVFAPTGIGAVYGKRAVLEAMPPWQGGGNMIQDVTFEHTTYHQPPFRFEAGTGSIGDAAGLGAALDYVMRLGIDNIDRYEHELMRYAEHHLASVPGLHMIGAPRHKAGVLSFVLDGQRTEDVGSALDKDGIAVRSGHHCAQPILRRFGHEASVRASLAFYNTCEDIDELVGALRRLQAGHGPSPR